MSAKGKRFQSGSEVFETYIPDYRSAHRSSDPTEDEIAEIVQPMLTAFGNRVQAAQGKLINDASSSNPHRH